MSAARVPVAVVGAGIGALHLEGYMRLRDEFDVRAVCDLDEDRARSVIAGSGCGAEATADLEGLLADDGIALVDVCLPPHLHLDAVLRTLAAGKDVVCEKPLATTPAELDLIAAKAREAGRKVYPVFQYRFNPGVRRLAALRESGACGKLYAVSIETHWNRGAAYYDNPWRGRWKTEGGGAVLGHAIHAHDILDGILGPVTAVRASVATLVNDIEVDDCAAVSFTLEGGALATSSVTLGASADTSRIRACFENVTVESGTSPQIDADDWTFSPRGEEHAEAIAAATALADGCLPGYAGLFGEIRRDLSGTDSKAVTLEAARSSIELCAAIYKSARSGAEVALPLPADDPVRERLSPG